MYICIKANTLLINSAANTLEFNSVEQLEQGAGTLYTITSQLTKGGDIGKTLDMKGREAAVALVDVRSNISKMLFYQLIFRK